MILLVCFYTVIPECFYRVSIPFFVVQQIGGDSRLRHSGMTKFITALRQTLKQVQGDGRAHSDSGAHSDDEVEAGERRGAE